MPSFMRDENGIPIECLRPKSTTALAFSGTAQATSEYTKTIIVRLSCTEDCHVEISRTAAADVSNTSMFLPAGSIEYFYVFAGDYVAAIQNSTTGTLYITEMT